MARFFSYSLFFCLFHCCTQSCAHAPTPLSEQAPDVICCFSFAITTKNVRLTPFDARRSKPPETEKSSRFRLLSVPMWHRTCAWLFLYIYFIFIFLSSDNTTVFPSYPVYSRRFPDRLLCDMECAPPHRQRPTLPGDFACLNPAQRAADKILTKYNTAHLLGKSEK